MKVDVSVIIPCLNRERFIGEAIDSALAQGDIQVIVVDDGSTDRSWAMIRSYGERIIAVRGAGRGPSAARNLGVAVAGRKYIYFLDSDDRIAPASLSVMAKESERLAVRQIAVGDTTNIDEFGHSLPGPTRGYAAIANPGEIPRTTVLSAPISTPLPLFPAAALREVGGFDERLRHFEDRELGVRLLCAGYTFVRIPTVICNIRDHADERLSSSAGDDKFRHMADALQTMSRCLLQSSCFVQSSTDRVAFAGLCWSTARAAARAKCKAVATEVFALADSIAGPRGRDARWPVSMMYWLLPPYEAEGVAEAVKRLLRAPKG